MTLEFNNVLPFPLQEYPHGSDSVWKNKFKIDFPKKVILNASSGKGKSTFVNTVYGIRQDFEGIVKCLQDSQSKISKTFPTEQLLYQKAQTLRVTAKKLRRLEEIFNEQAVMRTRRTMSLS